MGQCYKRVCAWEDLSLKSIGDHGSWNFDLALHLPLSATDPQTPTPMQALYMSKMSQNPTDGVWHAIRKWETWSPEAVTAARGCGRHFGGHCSTVEYSVSLNPFPSAILRSGVSTCPRRRNETGHLCMCRLHPCLVLGPSASASIAFAGRCLKMVAAAGQSLL